MRFSLGTMALGSLLLEIVQSVRFVLVLMDCPSPLALAGALVL